MTAQVRVAELAAWFWERAGPPPPFPRDLRGAVARSLLGSIVPLADLSVGRVLNWLSAAGVAPPVLRGPERPLRGALFARHGVGFLFVAADDDPAERRFTVAHELAHLLGDYFWPRQRAAAAHGPAVLDVLDGRRPPTVAERVHAVLRDVPAGPFAHLMARDDPRRASAVAFAEREADRLACELLAPAADVCARLGVRADRAARVLAETYGLPPAVASAYAAELFPAAPADPLLLRLEKSTGRCRTLPRGGEQI